MNDHFVLMALFAFFAHAGGDLGLTLTGPLFELN